MSEEQPSEDQPVDPKEQMRQALEAKKKQGHRNLDPANAASQTAQTHGRAGGKRQFRRKSG